MRKLMGNIRPWPGPRARALENLLISRQNHADAVSKFWQDFKGPLTPAEKKIHSRIVGSAAKKAKAAEKRVVRAVQKRLGK